MTPMSQEWEKSCHSCSLCSVSSPLFCFSSLSSPHMFRSIIFIFDGVLYFPLVTWWSCNSPITSGLFCGCLHVEAFRFSQHILTVTQIFIYLPWELKNVKSLSHKVHFVVMFTLNVKMCIHFVVKVFISQRYIWFAKADMKLWHHLHTPYSQHWQKSLINI